MIRTEFFYVYCVFIRIRTLYEYEVQSVPEEHL
jgi:hypothetical protein